MCMYTCMLATSLRTECYFTELCETPSWQCSAKALTDCRLGRSRGLSGVPLDSQLSTFNCSFVVSATSGAICSIKLGFASLLGATESMIHGTAFSRRSSEKAPHFRHSHHKLSEADAIALGSLLCHKRWRNTWDQDCKPTSNSWAFPFIANHI